MDANSVKSRTCDARFVNRDLVVGWTGFGPARDEDGDPAVVAELYGIYLLPEYWSRGMAKRFTEPQKLVSAKA